MNTVLQKQTFSYQIQYGHGHCQDLFRGWKPENLLTNEHLRPILLRKLNIFVFRIEE
jgi:hypothetical protein